MTTPYLDACVLSCQDLTAAGAFYRALGLPLEDEQHGEGPLHAACELGGLHFALYGSQNPGQATPRQTAGATMVGLRVESVDAAFAAGLAAGGLAVQEPADFPWGRRALLEDPDGRVVELNGKPPAKL